MSISESVDVIENALWPQGDMRDPLGIWGFRKGVTGDASGGSTKVTVRTAAQNAGAYVYTLYSALVAVVSGTQTADLIKIRILTAWPNIDPTPGVQAYGSIRMGQMTGDSDFTAPISGPTATAPLVGPLDRFLLLYDPRGNIGTTELVELELGVNSDLAVYSFEGYGYFWDRSVMQAPGGPRHPGSN